MPEVKSRPRVVLALLASVAAVTVLVLPQPAMAAGPRLAALGDSYASGWGASRAIPDPNDCGRTANAYGRAWADTHAHESFQNLTCKGYTADHVRRWQVPAMSTATTMVTLTAGGNDVGFSRTMEACRTPLGLDCDSEIARSRREIDAVVPGRMDALFRDLANKLPSTATVYVLGYPRLYTEVPFCGVFSINAGDRHQLNLASNALNTRIREATARADAAWGERFRFVDVSSRFASHGLCSSDPWLLGPMLDIEKSYHPNDAGQRLGYLAALRSLTG